MLGGLTTTLPCQGTQAQNMAYFCQSDRPFHGLLSAVDEGLPLRTHSRTCVYTRLRLAFYSFHPRVRLCDCAKSTPAPICKYGRSIFTPTAKLYSWRPLVNSYMPWNTKYLSERLFLFCLQFRVPSLRMHVKSDGTVKHVHHGSESVRTTRAWAVWTASWLILSSFLPTFLSFFLRLFFVYLFISLSIRNFSC